MKRIVARSLPLFLLTQLGVYILLPFFGSAWHNLAPEHDHLYLGAAQADDVALTVFTSLDAAAVSAGRLGIGFGEKVPARMPASLDAGTLDAGTLDVGTLGASSAQSRSGADTVVHAFNPAAALQVFAIVMAFGALTLLLVPRGLSQRVAHAELFLRFPPMLPLDPPPVA